MLSLAAGIAVFVVRGCAVRVRLSEWEVLEGGLEKAELHVEAPGAAEEHPILAVRVCPATWELCLAAASPQQKGGRKTAREWAEAEGYALAVNGGMYHASNLHDGFLQHRGQVLNEATNHYQSVAVFDPLVEDAPPFRLVDVDTPGMTIEILRTQYASLIQNLRLIRHSGENRWSRQERKWSEAALGEDEQGRMLFIFSRTPYSMFDFNKILLKANLGLVSAQHLDGGPPAQLYLKVGYVEIEQAGSYETGVNENDNLRKPRKIPIVLGLRKRATPVYRPATEPLRGRRHRGARGILGGQPGVSGTRSGRAQGIPGHPRPPGARRHQLGAGMHPGGTACRI